LALFSRSKTSGVPAYWGMVSAMLAALIAVGIAAPRVFDDLSNFVFDSYQRLSPRGYDPAIPVRIVDIDEASIAALGQWPWPRTRLAELVTKIGDQGAAAIGFDIVLAEPDRTSPENLLPLLPDGEERKRLGAAIAGLPSHDVVFANAIKDRPVVLGALFTPDANKGSVEAKSGFALAGDPPGPFLMQFAGVVAPLPAFQTTAAGIGALNWAPDRDLVVRRAPVVLGHGETIQPSLAAELLRVAQQASTFILRSSNASGESAFGAQTGLNAVKIGDLEIPTSARGDIRVRYSPTERQRFLSAAKLLEGSIPASEIEGRIILLGSSAAGLADLRATPLDPSVPGVEVHAQILEHMLEGRALIRPDWAPAAEWSIAIMLSLVVSFVAIKVAPLAGAAFGAVAVALLWFGSWLAFSRADLLIDPLFATGASGIVYLSGVVTLFRSERMRRVAVRAAFSRFVSPDVVEAIAEAPEKLKLGGEIRPLTLMFSDVRNFTGLSEGRDAEDLTRFMNSYLSPMTEIILETRGTLDKYMGDAIMAFWNAPLDDADHARHAVEAALAMLKRLEDLNAGWAKEADESRPFRPMRIGIGISTGTGCVGNFGSERRFDYSVLGDEVNIASRLEALTKRYGIAIIASEATRLAVPDMAWLPLERVRLLGRSAPTLAFLLAGDEKLAGSAGFQAWSAAHGLVRSHFEQGDIPKALAAINVAKKAAPEAFWPLYAHWDEEWRHLAADSSKDQAWTGVLDLTAKF
jgi:adenylate cyclase